MSCDLEQTCPSFPHPKMGLKDHLTVPLRPHCGSVKGTQFTLREAAVHTPQGQGTSSAFDPLCIIAKPGWEGGEEERAVLGSPEKHSQYGIYVYFDIDIDNIKKDLL